MLRRQCPRADDTAVRRNARSGVNANATIVHGRSLSDMERGGGYLCDLRSQVVGHVYGEKARTASGFVNVAGGNELRPLAVPR